MISHQLLQFLLDHSHKVKTALLQYVLGGVNGFLSSHDFCLLCTRFACTRKTTALCKQGEATLAHPFPGIHTLHDPIGCNHIDIMFLLTMHHIHLHIQQILVFRIGHVFRNKMSQFHAKRHRLEPSSMVTHHLAKGVVWHLCFAINVGDHTFEDAALLSTRCRDKSKRTLHPRCTAPQFPDFGIQSTRCDSTNQFQMQMEDGVRMVWMV